MKVHDQKPRTGHHFGVWIDLSRAMICRRDRNGSVITEELHSGIETHPRYAGEGTDKTGMFRHTLDHQKSHQGHLAHELHIFLRKVADRLQDPAHVTILGPGEVRFELQKELERRKEFKEVPMDNRASDKIPLEILVRLIEHESIF